MIEYNPQPEPIQDVSRARSLREGIVNKSRTPEEGERLSFAVDMGDKAYLPTKSILCSPLPNDYMTG